MDEPSDRFAAALTDAQRARLPVARQAQLNALILRLAESGLASDDPRADLFFAPLLHGPVTTEGMPTRPAQDHTSPGGQNGGTPPPASRRRVPIPGIAAALILTQLVTRAAPPGGGPVAERAVDAAVTAVQSGPQAFAQVAQVLLNWPIMVAIVVLLAAIGGVVAAWPRIENWLDRRRRQHLSRNELSNRGELVRIVTRAAHASLFDDADLAGPLRRLRRYRAIPSQRIDVRASIRATLAGGAGPVVRHARRRLSPDFVLISERERAHDHLAEVAVAWRDRLHRAGIACEHYEFYGAPNTLRLRTDDRGRKRDDLLAQPLEAVLARHGAGHAMVMLESFDAVPNAAAAPNWLLEAQRTLKLHQMNPRDPQHWDGLEARLETLGMLPYAASAAGVGDLAEQVGRTIDGDDATLEPRPGPGQPDLAAYLNAHRDLVLSSDRPDPRQIAQIVDVLERWLDRESYLWLRALALFPTINTGFTFFSGCVLEDVPLLTHRRFLALARLPWLRAGTMPDWLREALAETLAPPELRRAAATIAAFLDPPANAAEGEFQLIELRRAAEQPRNLRRLAARLEAAPSAFRDPLLLEALRGRAPRDLSAAVAGTLAEPPPPWWRSGRLTAGVAAALGTALLLTLQPAGLRDYWGVVALQPRQGDPLPPRPVPPAKPSAGITPSPPPPPIVQPQADTTQATKAAQPVQAPTASASAAPTAASIRVYIQYSGASQLSQANAAKAALDGAVIGGLPVIVPPFENRGSQTPSRTQLRCFDDGGCKAAGEVVQRLAKAGVDAQVIRWPGGLGNARANHLELWFANVRPSRGIDNKADFPSGIVRESRPKPQIVGPSQQTVPSTGPKVYIVFFDWDKSDITPESASILDNIADDFRSQGPLQIDVACRTDSGRSAQYSMGLTGRQATNVQAYLEGRGVPGAYIATQSFGGSQPSVGTADGVREPQNRRCDISTSPVRGATAN